MLRMRRILTGISMKTVDMNDKIQTALTTKIIRSKVKSLESVGDDN